MRNKKPGTSKRRKAVRGVGCGLAVLLVILTLTVIAAGATPPAIPITPSGHRQLQSVYVPMEDGTKIAVRIGLPPDLLAGEQVPTILEATRHPTDQKYTFLLNVALKLAGESKANLKIGHALMEAGYAYVRVDARGTNASFGKREIEWSEEEIDDIGQVIDWLVAQPWSDGKVATYGVSYSGNTAELAAALNHPNLVVAAPLYSDFEPLAHNAMPGGIYNAYLIESWTQVMTVDDANLAKGPFSGGIAPVDDDQDGQLLNEALRERDNTNLAQAFENVVYFDDNLTGQYTAYSLAPFHRKDEIQRAGTPFYVRVGWWDVGTVDGALERFLTYENSQNLVIGPWNHGGFQAYDPFLGVNSSEASVRIEQEREVTAFFDNVMKESGPDLPHKEIRYYTLGEGVWKTTPVWPVEGFAPTAFYFYPDGSMKKTVPDNETGSNRYEVDFSATTGENNRWHTNLGAPPVIYADRAEEDRKLLTYTSDPLATDIEITGKPVATLNLSSTATDGALYVYLEAVSPEGEVTYITEGQLRALHRKESSSDLGRVVLGPKHSYRRADGQAMVPGENTELRIGMFATSVLVKKRYRLRIAIAGHDASTFDRIPKDGTPTIEVQANGSLPSFVELPMKIRE